MQTPRLLPSQTTGRPLPRIERLCVILFMHLRVLTMRYFLSIWAILTCFALDVRAQSSADTVMVTLESAINRALEISPEVGAVSARRDYAAARRRLAKSYRFLSEFEATSAHSVSPGLKNIDGIPKSELYLDPDVRNDWSNLAPFNFLEIEAIQPLYTWGELSGNIDAASFGVHLEQGVVDETALEVAARTAEIYYGLLLADALSRLTDEANDAVSKAIDEIENLIDDGDPDVDDADLFQVQIAEQEVIRRVAEVTQGLRTMQSALARQLFLPDGAIPNTGSQRLTVVPFSLEPLPYYEELALANRPELVQVDAGISARSALVSVAQSDYYPKLFLGASSKYSFAVDRYRQRNPYVGDSFLSRGFQAGFAFRQKLNFGQTKAKVEQAQSELAETQYQEQAVRQLILFEVEEAYRNVLSARAAVDTQAEALRLSKEWLRSEEINFDLDLGDTENLVKAVQSNLELQAVNHEAVHQYNVAVVKLLKTTGTLIHVVQNGTFVE